MFTYDVEYIISGPLTIQCVADLLKYKTLGNANGIINCEDYPYIAAGMVVRLESTGTLSKGAFPTVNRILFFHLSAEILKIGLMKTFGSFDGIESLNLLEWALLLMPLIVCV